MTEDEQKLSKRHDGSKEKAHQLDKQPGYESGREERADLEEAEFSHKGGRSASAGTKDHRQRAEAAAKLEDLCGRLRKKGKIILGKASRMEGRSKGGKRRKGTVVSSQ